MTWIIGFREANYGCLLGDIRVSRRAGPVREFGVQKVHVVAPNLVVGFAGHIQPAFRFVDALSQLFEGRGLVDLRADRLEITDRIRRVQGSTAAELGSGWTCHLLMVSTGPRRGVDGASGEELPWAPYPCFGYRFKIPAAPLGVVVDELPFGVPTALGSGSNVPAYRRALENSPAAIRQRLWDLSDRAGVDAPVLIHALLARAFEEALRSRPHPTVSEALMAATVVANRSAVVPVGAVTPSLVTAEDQQATSEELPVAASWRELHRMASDAGLPRPPASSSGSSPGPGISVRCTGDLVLVTCPLRPPGPASACHATFLRHRLRVHADEERSWLTHEHHRASGRELLRGSTLEAPGLSCVRRAVRGELPDAVPAQRTDEGARPTSGLARTQREEQMSRPLGNRKKVLHPTVVRYERVARAGGLARTTTRNYALDVQAMFVYALQQELGRELTPDELADGGVQLAADLEVDLDAFDSELIQDFVIELDDRDLSKSHRRRVVFALRSFYEWRATVNPEVEANPAKTVKAPPQGRPLTIRYEDSEAAAILAAAKAAVEAAPEGPVRLRRWVELMALCVLRFSGVRVSEASNIRIADLHRVAMRLDIHNGKGGVHREIPIPQELIDVYDAYLEHARPHLPGDTYLLSNPYAFEGSQTYGRLVPRAIHEITGKYGDAAAVAAPHHPHRYRHTFACTLLNHGADLETIRIVLGHADIADHQAVPTPDQPGRHPQDPDGLDRVPHQRRRRGPRHRRRVIREGDGYGRPLLRRAAREICAFLCASGRHRPA